MSSGDAATSRRMGLEIVARLKRRWIPAGSASSVYGDPDARPMVSPHISMRVPEQEPCPNPEPGEAFDREPSQFELAGRLC